MIILRIKERARHRISEWFAAANMLGFGMSLLAPGDTFSSASYQAFRQMLPYEPFGLTPEQQWGFLIATTGFLWLIGLIINGSRQRATMHIRASCGLVGGVVYALSGILSALWSVSLVPGVLGRYTLHSRHLRAAERCLFVDRRLELFLHLNALLLQHPRRSHRTGA